MKKLIFILLLLCSYNLYSVPTVGAFRASQMGKGMNYPWLEEYWVGSSANNYSNFLSLASQTTKLNATKAQLGLMKQMGFNTVRLPVSFYHFQDINIAMDTSAAKMKFIDSVIVWSKYYGLLLVIDYHHGYAADVTINADTLRINAHWKAIATYYKNAITNSKAWAPDTNRVVFEVFNEPFGVSNSNCKGLMNSAVVMIRSILPNHTVIVGSGNYYSQYNLSSTYSSIITDPTNNIIYTFHFYEPFLFTHQGASWVGGDVSTIYMPFPYGSTPMPAKNPACVSAFGVSQYNNYPHDATCTNLYNTMNIAKSFSITKNVPIWLGEWGTYKRYMPTGSARCDYTKCIRDNCVTLGIPWAYWEWNEDFSLFNNNIPSVANMPVCFKTALGLSSSSTTCTTTVSVPRTVTTTSTVYQDSTYVVPCGLTNQPCCPN